MSQNPARLRTVRDLSLGAGPDASPEAAWISINEASQELCTLIGRSRSGITGSDVLASIRRCNKLTSHAEWVVGRLIEEAR